MTVRTLTIAPEYLSFYVAGSHQVEISLDVERRRIVANRDCINVPALCWNDGDTRVILGSLAEIERPDAPDFDGLLRTPSGVLILFDANEDNMATLPAATQKTRVRIWINHPTEPDEVTIAVGD